MEIVYRVYDTVAKEYHAAYYSNISTCKRIITDLVQHHTIFDKTKKIKGKNYKDFLIKEFSINNTENVYKYDKDDKGKKRLIKLDELGKAIYL